VRREQPVRHSLAAEKYLPHAEMLAAPADISAKPQLL
jgi:hypothetical protein